MNINMEEIYRILGIDPTPDSQPTPDSAPVELAEYLKTLNDIFVGTGFDKTQAFILTCVVLWKAM